MTPKALLVRIHLGTGQNVGHQNELVGALVAPRIEMLPTNEPERDAVVQVELLRDAFEAFGHQ